MAIPLVRLPALEYPTNALLNLQPINAALDRRRRAEEFDARLGLDTQRFGLEEEIGRGRLGLDRERLGIERGGLDIRRDSLRLQQEAAEREERERQTVRLGNLAATVRGMPDRTMRGTNAIQFIWNTPGLADTLARHGVRLNRETAEVEDYDRALDFIISQVPDARTRYAPTVVSGQPGTQLFEVGTGPGPATARPIAGTPERLTPTDRRAIIEADNAVRTASSTISTLEQALRLNDRAREGRVGGNWGLLTQHPDTLLFSNLMTQQVLTQLRSIFGGNPTEGEREILASVAGSVTQPREVRAAIINRALVSAREHLAANRQRAEQIRSGTFYSPTQPPAGQPPPTTTPGPRPRARNAAGAEVEFDGTNWVPVTP